MNMSEIKIRRMKLSDYKEVYALWTSCKGIGLNNLDDSREGIKKFLKRNPKTCLAAVKGREIAGVLMAGTDGRRGYIYHTAVKEGMRRQKIAQKLTERVLLEIEKLEINKAALVVFERNQAGNAFWESMGFTKREDIVYRNKVIRQMTRFDT